MPNLGQTIADLQARRRGAPSARADPRLVETPSFGSDPGALRMLTYAPADLAPGAGLVVVLHGCTQTAADYAAPVGWLDLAERFGFVVLAPEQRRSNNSNLCFNWYEPGDTRRTGGEAESIARMTDHTIAAFDLDPRRVFVTGLSAGGAMAAVMLATYPDRFAGGAVVAGLPFGVANSLPEALQAMGMTSPPSPRSLGSRVRAASAHAGPWPVVSVWHGEDDGLVRPAAGEGVAAQWRDVHGAVGPARNARTPDGRDFLVWLSPAGEPVVELHRIAGLGHGAPVMADGVNGCGGASRYTPDIGVSSTFEIALAWGLVERDPAANQRRTAPPPPSPAPAPRRGEPVDVSAIITDALRTAGLVRWESNPPRGVSGGPLVRSALTS